MNITITEKDLLNIKGGINWGSVAGSCAKGALFGAAFGGAAAVGCIGSAGLNLGNQILWVTAE